MILKPTPLAGAFVIECEKLVDERGFFARTFSASDFLRAGLEPAVSECSISYNHRRGTLRGMHYQKEPHAEAKLVRCTQGTVFDVIVDLRENSATLAHWFSVELSASNRLALYVPHGFAHGFQTLTDETEVYYQISAPHTPEAARGVRWDDPAFEITWPDGARTISERDRHFPDYRR